MNDEEDFEVWYLKVDKAMCNFINTTYKINLDYKEHNKFIETDEYQLDYGNSDQRLYRHAAYDLIISLWHLQIPIEMTAQILTSFMIRQQVYKDNFELGYYIKEYRRPTLPSYGEIK